ncbi:hypothetical protein KP509_12G051500 [Ceratopteris richardii]|uniref:Uncharacterized protein n=1 Tax=Ceratopteris richardii TaxID=49495 RepID=A0A8T2TJ37_CERRI|nr:hypothetical protein KP509_12G051500 [Ceratopteris richardii]
MELVISQHCLCIKHRPSLSFLDYHGKLIFSCRSFLDLVCASLFSPWFPDLNLSSCLQTVMLLNNTRLHVPRISTGKSRALGFSNMCSECPLYLNYAILINVTYYMIASLHIIYLPLLITNLHII